MPSFKGHVVPGSKTGSEKHGTHQSLHQTQCDSRIRHDRIDKSGTVTLRVHGQLRHIGIGRIHAGTHVILLIQDLKVRVAHAIAGELLRELTIDLERDHQPRTLK